MSVVLKYFIFRPASVTTAISSVNMSGTNWKFSSNCYRNNTFILDKI